MFIYLLHLTFHVRQAEVVYPFTYHEIQSGDAVRHGNTPVPLAQSLKLAL